MPASLAALGYGTVFEVETSTPTVYETIEESMKVGGPNQKLDTKDTSNFLSPNGYKEFIAGMREGGEVTWEGNYLPKQTVQSHLQGYFIAGTVKNYKIVLPNAMGTWTFAAVITAISPSVPTDDRMTYTGTLKITGQPVLS